MWAPLQKTSCRRGVAARGKVLTWFFGTEIFERKHPCPPSPEKPPSLSYPPHPFQTLGALHIKAVCDKSPYTLCFVHDQEDACGWTRQVYYALQRGTCTLRNREASSQRMLERTRRGWVWVWVRGGFGEGPRKQGFALHWELSGKRAILRLGILMTVYLNKSCL